MIPVITVSTPVVTTAHTGAPPQEDCFLAGAEFEPPRPTRLSSAPAEGISTATSPVEVMMKCFVEAGTVVVRKGAREVARRPKTPPRALFRARAPRTYDSREGVSLHECLRGGGGECACVLPTQREGRGNSPGERHEAEAAVVGRRVDSGWSAAFAALAPQCTSTDHIPPHDHTGGAQQPAYATINSPGFGGPARSLWWPAPRPVQRSRHR